MAKMVRLNTRISETLNDWLNNETINTGLPKSTLVMLALENYREQREDMVFMVDMNAVKEKLEQIIKQLSS